MSHFTVTLGRFSWGFMGSYGVVHEENFFVEGSGHVDTVGVRGSSPLPRTILDPEQ